MSETSERKRRANVHLTRLPNQSQYEYSYAHLSTVTHVAVSSTNFFVSGDSSGTVKLWKKAAHGIEFIKKFKSHESAIRCLTTSADGFFLATTSEDFDVKIFDIVNFDMIHTLVLDFEPLSCAWIHKKTCEPLLAVSHAQSSKIAVFRTEGNRTSRVLCEIDIHRAPVHVLSYSSASNAVVSVDKRSRVELWSAESVHAPADEENKVPEVSFPTNVTFEFKSETDLFVFQKQKLFVHSVEFSSDGKFFSVVSSDANILIFDAQSAKIHLNIDNSAEFYQKRQADRENTADEFSLEPMILGHRAALERELVSTRDESPRNAVFDESGEYVLFGCLLGVRVYHIHTGESTYVGYLDPERYMNLALFQGRSTEEIGASFASNLRKDFSLASDFEEDPTIFATGARKSRFYLLTRSAYSESHNIPRDVVTERAKKEKSKAQRGAVLPHKCTIHTTYGDITLSLESEKCKKTVENFATHSRNGYYDGLIFHRVIKGFMLQTGDPLGDGSGGESIWGGNFRDEIVEELRFDRPGVLAMANSGPNTNGSQFFITCVECPWLQKKHTVFGFVTEGMDIVHAIENAPCDESDRPEEDIKIINIRLYDS